MLIKVGNENCVVEVKMRDPNHLDMESFYKKYKIDDDINVVVVNYSKENLYFYGDFKSELRDVSLTAKQNDDLELLVRQTTNIRNLYARFDLFNMFMKNESFEIESDFISGFKDACMSMESFREIEGIYGDYFPEILKAIDNFNLSNQSCVDSLEGSGPELYNHIKNEIIPRVRAEYDNMRNRREYTHFPQVDIDIGAMIDNHNKELYDITSNYSPSLYVPFIRVEKIESTRFDHYKKYFGSVDLTNLDDYSMAAFSMSKNVLCSNNIEALLGKKRVHESVASHLMKGAHPSTFVKSKLLSKESLQAYDLNIYVNNTYSYCDKKVMDSKKKICGFERKKHSISSKKKDSVLLSEKACDSDFVESYLSTFEGYYNNDSIREDLRTYHQTFSDCTEIDADLLDEISYYSYYTSNLFSAMIALSQINNKKYRVLQCYDPNTICFMLPNGDLNDKKPVRYFTMSITSNYDDIKLNQIMGVYHSHKKALDKYIILSKVMTLDINRVKLLANSFVKYMILTSYHKTFAGYSELRKITNFNNLLYTNMVTLQTLDVTENFKNIIMVCYSDYGNPNKLIKDKMTPRLKNYTCMQLTLRMIKAIYMSSKQRNMIIKNQNKAEISDDGREILNSGFRITDDMRLPLSGLLTNNPREILQESYIIFYLGNKTLHGSPQELISLYKVPYDFEQEYKKYLDEHSTVVQERTKDNDYGFSFESTKLTTINAYAEQLPKKSIIRSVITKDLQLDDPLLSLPQFSSTKSMVTNDHTCEIKDLYTEMSFIEFKNWLHHVQFTDVDRFVSDSNARIRLINTKRELDENTISEIFGESEKKDKSQLPYLRKEVLPNGNYYITAKPTTYCRYSITDKRDSDNNKVFDEMLMLTSDDSNLSVRNALTNLKGNKTENNYRIFNKDQRTYNDREIYTGNKESRLCLYSIEKLFLSHNKFIEEEAITISGDQKHKKMYDQRLSLLKEGRYKKHGPRVIISVSSDASKWSARDSYVKFIICIAYNPFLTSEEKWFYMYCLCRYYHKNIVITEKVLHSMYELCKGGKEGNYEEMTNDFTKNYFTVRSNWLQGNLNRISSFVHYCSSLMVKKTLEVSNDMYKDLNIVRFLVHSDDSTYDLSMSTNESVKKDLSYRKDYGRFIVSIIKVCEKRHSITLNEKKTYLSTFYKEFLSTLIVGNVLSYFYLADLIPIASDLAYNSPLEDTASLSSFIQNAFAHSAPYSIVRTAINLINYVSLKTYNLNHSSSKSPLNHFTENSRYTERFAMVPISLLPIYRFPVEMAGIIPYHCADAYYILMNIIRIIKLDENSPIESQINYENMKYYLENCPKPYLNYIKACMFSYDSTMFKIDEEDPYTTKDLAVNTIISLSKPSRGKRSEPRYQSYKEFKLRRSEILKKSVCHPEWLLTRPKDMDDSRDSILSNYLKPTFIESLSFSTPAMEYGSRVIHSNRSMYRLNVKGHKKDKLYNIVQVYDEIVSISRSIEVDPMKLYSYLYTFLFSDKEVSYALQTILSKEEYQSIPKCRLDLKITTPASLFRRDKGALSVTTIINEIFTHCGHVSTMDSKYESIIDYSYNLLTGFNLSGVKIYRSYLDIDENYNNYASFVKTNTDEFDDVVTTLDICSREDLRLKIHEIRLIYKSLLIRYFNDMLKADCDEHFEFDNYPTPQSILSTVSKYSTRDVVTSKIYMSAKKTNRKDDYWLSRLGLYQDEYMYKKYRLGTRYNLNYSDKFVTNDNDRYYIDKFVSICNHMMKADVSKDFTKIKIGQYNYDDMIKKLNYSENLNHKILLNKLGQLSDQGLDYHISRDNRVKNHWLVPTKSVDGDPNCTSVIYMNKSNFLKITTVTAEHGVLFNVAYYYQVYDQKSLASLIAQMSKDYRDMFQNNIFYSRQEGKPIYIDRYSTLSLLPEDRVGNMNSCYLYYKSVHYRSLSLRDVDIVGNRHMYTVAIGNHDNDFFSFVFKDNLSYERDDLLSPCLQNIESYPRLAVVIANNKLCNEDNTFDVIRRLDSKQISWLSTQLGSVSRARVGKKYINKMKNDTIRAIVKTYLLNNQDIILEHMELKYQGYAKLFFDFYISLMSDVTEEISSESVMAGLIQMSELSQSSMREIDISSHKPFGSVFYRHMSANFDLDDIPAVLECILLYIIRSAIRGTDFYFNLIDQDAYDSDSSDDF
nr:RNA dependent RNA polymerase [Clematis yellow mottle associated virus]